MDTDRRRHLPPRWRRGVGLVNGIQTVAIVATVAGLVAAGAPQFVMPVVCLIVGVHFLPLRRLFDQPQYRWTGVALIVVAVAGLGGLGDPALSRGIVGLGAAATLWATAAHLAVRG